MKAKAINSPFLHAIWSLQNSVRALVSFAYGTQERANITMIFALSLALIGSILHSSEMQTAIGTCTVL